MIASTIRFLATHFTLSFFFMGLACSFYSMYRYRGYLTRAFIAESLLSYYCLFSLGLASVYNFVIHLFFHSMAARFIGWADSPFQLELAFASLGMGLAAMLAYRRDARLRLGVIVATSVFFWGCAIGHLHQLKVNHDYAPGNAGLALWTDLLQPFIGIGLLLFSAVTMRRTPVARSRFSGYYEAGRFPFKQYS